MRVNHHRVAWSGLVILALALLLNFSNTPPVQAQGPSGRWIVVAKSDADFDALRAETLRLGGKVLNEIRETKTLVVAGSDDFKARAKTSQHVQGVAKDNIRALVTPNHKLEFFNTLKSRERIRIDLGKPFFKKKINPDPAFSLTGLMWNVLRIRAPQAWKISIGSPSVQVAVVDTGLDFTHAELKNQVAQVVDLTVNENPALCKSLTGYSDQDLANLYGGPATTDWNGHGTWVGGNIAAALDEQGINGIAPKVKLVALKIAQWCGYAYDSTIIDAIRYAANNRIAVVNISFNGYLDRTIPDHEVIYKQFVEAVKFARQKGTLIVASGGNEHVRIDQKGQVTSHGSLTIPGDPLIDYFGMWEIPAGIPGVIMVSATNNIVNSASATCPAGTIGSDPNTEATCKPASDKHQPIGTGKQNQLAYYSNYGPRVDVTAPGGARKFNLPRADRGGTPGYPVTTVDGFNAWQDFGITSNWSVEVPCYFNLGESFPANQCYTSIQGTSMAAPHVAAVAALMASRNPLARHNPWLLEMLLKAGAQRIKGNTTPGLSATDTSPGDLTGLPCPNGYCHLAGSPISDREAYGAGLVDAHIVICTDKDKDKDDHDHNKDDQDKEDQDHTDDNSDDGKGQGGTDTTKPLILLPLITGPSR